MVQSVAITREEGPPVKKLSCSLVVGFVSITLVAPTAALAVKNTCQAKNLTKGTPRVTDLQSVIDG